MAGAKPVQREKYEQATIVQLLEAVGGRVYTLGTRRRRGANCPACGTFVAEHQGTRQTPGLCDLLVYLPRRRDWSQLWRLLLVECKAAEGRLSPAQQDFRALAIGAGVDHITGDAVAVEAWLRAQGYLKAEEPPRDLLSDLCQARAEGRGPRHPSDE